MNKQEELKEIYGYHYWRHRISLGDNLFTPGTRFESQWDDLHFPDNFNGMTFLDVGSNDGMYSFLAESKGASEVYSVDIYHEDEHNWEMTNGWPIKGIKTAKLYKNSNIQIHSLSIENLDQLNRKFDYIYCGNVIIWIDNPYGAHQKLIELSNKVIHLREDIIDNDEPAQFRFSKIWKPNSKKPYLAANKTYYREVFGHAGFKNVEFHYVDEQQQYLEYIRKCPKVNVKKGAQIFGVPSEANSMSELAETKVGRYSETVNDKYFVTGIGWVPKEFCEIIPENLASPGIKQKAKSIVNHWKEGNSRERNMVIIASK
ncbi:MAG: class I SAM-dependent methyltransferase [Flavobacteriales bacterium]